MTYKELNNKLWFKVYNHWLCPLGNFHEPLPTPQHRIDQAPDNTILAWLWWTTRNPLHNFSHFWIGITPVSEYWLKPEVDGWVKGERYWHCPKCFLIKKLPRYNGYFGWQDRGNFRLGMNND